jgi:MYXO-CTERM domain-containing protein
MMRKRIFIMIVAMLFTASAANAAVYRFTFESFDAELTAAVQITVNTAGEVTGVSGVISGLTNQTISSVAANPSFPDPAYSLDGSFIYNNLYHASGMAFDIDGLLFATAQDPGGYWNLWANSPGSYSLWESVGSYNYPIEESGNLSVTAAPELSTWAMLALGFAGLGVVGRRRRGPRLAPSLG